MAVRQILTWATVQYFLLGNCIPCKVLKFVTMETTEMLTKYFRDFWLVWPESYATLALLVSLHTSPRHKIKHRNFTFGADVHLYPLYMTIKYVIILTYSCKMAAIVVIFFNWVYCPHSHTDLILHIQVYASYVYLR